MLPVYYIQTYCINKSHLEKQKSQQKWKKLLNSCLRTKKLKTYYVHESYMNIVWVESTSGGLRERRN